MSVKTPDQAVADHLIQFKDCLNRLSVSSPEERDSLIENLDRLARGIRIFLGRPWGAPQSQVRDIITTLKSAASTITGLEGVSDQAQKHGQNIQKRAEIIKDAAGFC